MKKLNLKPSIKLPSKTVLLVGTAVLILVVLIALGAVQKVDSLHEQQAAVEKTQAEHDSLVRENNTLKSQNRQLQADVTKYSAYYGSTCDWVRSLQKTYKYQVPPLCQIKQ